MKKLLTFFAISAIALPAVAISQRGTMYTSDGELPCGLINSIEQCQSGFIWIATENGLCRFDGYRFHTYLNNKSDSTTLRDNYVHDVKCDANGTLLIGTLKGLQQYVPSSDSFRDVPMYESGKRVYPHIADISMLSNDDVLISTAGYGVIKMDRQTGIANPVEGINQKLSNKYVSCLFEDRNHALWIGTENGGLLYYFPQGSQTYSTPEIPGNKISAITQDEDGNIYVSTLDGGIVRFTENGIEPIKGSENLSVKTLTKIGETIYAGTEGYGAKIVEGDQLKDLPQDSPLLGVAVGKVHQIVEDKAGNIWLGLFQKGVAMVPSRKFNFYSYGPRHEKSPIGDGCVMAMAVDQNQNLWVSCENEGVYMIGPQGQELLHVGTPSTILTIYPDDKGNCWLGSYTTGLFTVNSSGNLKPIQALAGNKISTMTHDKKGHLFIGTLNTGVLHYNPEKESVTRVELEPENREGYEGGIVSVNSISNIADSVMWIAHYRGVVKAPILEDGKLGKYEEVITGCIGYKLMQSHDGKVWIGTNCGLYVYDPATGKMEHYTESDGLPSNVICAMLEDDKNFVWISTYHGVSRFTPLSRQFVNFDAGDGLQGNEFTHGVSCRDNMGKLYFGGTNGYTTFHPYDIVLPDKGRKPMITQFDVMGASSNSKSRSSAQKITGLEIWNAKEVYLDSDENTFSIAFSTMSFDNPHKTSYEYRILEHGKEWTPTEPGESRCTFNNLPPGTYHFEVREAGASTLDAIRALTINVSAPWYRTWWMIVVYCIIGICILWLVYRQWSENQRRQKEELKVKHAEDIMEARLQFFTNIAHEIRTPLTLIINPAEKLMRKGPDDPEYSTYNLIHRNASRLLRLVNQLMDMRKLEKGQMRLHFRLTELVSYIEAVNTNFAFIARQKNIEFKFNHEMAEQKGWIDNANFDKILINILSNAFKYAPAGGVVTVTLSTGTNEKEEGPLHRYIEIVVANTGDPIEPNKLEKIFDRYYRLENEATASAMGTGIGLHLCRQLITMHHGEIFARNLEDGKGCEFVVRIPQGSNHLSIEELDANPAINRPMLIQNNIIDVDAEDPELEKNKAKTRFSIAIAEDDEEMRAYLHNELSRLYKVATYSNGRELLDAMLSKAPDLVIADVMMPELDGYELCRKIRKNANINHVPVILLTAKQDPEDRKVGLEAGADSFMVKPFDIEVLMTTIANLLANRQLLKAKFSGAQEQADTVTKIELKSHDEVLFNKIMKVINDNLSSPDLSVEQLAEEVGLSRVHLHRKLKEFTNLSAHTFIRDLRLRQAARLLREKKLSVAEVAYATGFSNPARFTSAFKDMYGITPSQFSVTNE